MPIRKNIQKPEFEKKMLIMYFKNAKNVHK